MFSTSNLDAQVQTLQRRVRESSTQLDALKAQLAAAEAAVLHQQRVGQNLEPEWQAEVMAALNGGHVPSFASSATSVPLGYAAGDDAREEEEDKDEDEEMETRNRPAWAEQRYPLSKEEYKRFGRQLVMPEIGLRGQLRLKRARVLVVGVGGLGCPAAAYLAGAGVGTIGLVDGDVVEVSNLHRQIAHSTARVGSLKVDSAIEYLEGLNPNPNYIPHRAHLSPTEAIALFTAYDVVLDCTDHPTSRYLISDACVLTGRPLVSASALRTEGQLTVLNNPPRAPGAPDGGPCYRCVFPKPPPPESVVSCGDGGILGPVVGVMGVMQALETIKLIAGGIKYDDAFPRSRTSSTLSSFSHLFSSTTSPNRDDDQDEDEDEDSDDDESDQDDPTTTTKTTPPSSPSLLLFSAYTVPQFRNIRLRPRRKDCAVCSSTPRIHSEDLTNGTLSYPLFCGTLTPPPPPPPSTSSLSSRLSPTAFATLVAGRNTESANTTTTTTTTTILDVRPETEFALAALPSAINIPFSTFASKIKEYETEIARLGRGGGGSGSTHHIVVVCRRGNDSVVAAGLLRGMMMLGGGEREGGREEGGEEKSGLRVWDLRGGLEAWGREVDVDWPVY